MLTFQCFDAFNEGHIATNASMNLVHMRLDRIRRATNPFLHHVSQLFLRHVCVCVCVCVLSRID